MAPSLICVCYRNLDQNSIQTIDPASFKGLPVVRSLRLDSNKLEAVPTQALAPLKMLEILWVYILMLPCALCNVTCLEFPFTSRKIVLVSPPSFRSCWLSSSLLPEAEELLNWKCGRLRRLLQAANPKADNFFDDKSSEKGTAKFLNNLETNAVTFGSCYNREEHTYEFTIYSSPLAFLKLFYYPQPPGSEIVSRWGLDFPYPSRPAVWPTQFPEHWLPGLKQPRHGVHHPPPSRIDVNERVKLYLCSLSVWTFMASSSAKFTVAFRCEVYRCLPLFQASAAMLMRSALFWGVTQRQVVILYRRFGTTYRSHLQRSRMKQCFSGLLDSWRWLIRCPETSVKDCHLTQCNTPDERRSYLYLDLQSAFTNFLQSCYFKLRFILLYKLGTP
jgi:hypothetical protein